MPVTSDADLAALAGPALRRQFSIEVGPTVRPAEGAGQEVALSVYRLEDPADATAGVR